MKTPIINILVCGSFYFASLNAAELTAEDIASHLDISHWSGEVSLPEAKFTVAIYPVKNGEIAKDAAIFDRQSFLHGKNLKILVSEVGQRVRWTLKLGSTISACEYEGQLLPEGGSMRSKLPTLLDEGVYVLLGKYKKVNGVTQSSGKAEDVEVGYVLEVTSSE